MLLFEESFSLVGRACCHLSSFFFSLAEGRSHRIRGLKLLVKEVFTSVPTAKDFFPKPGVGTGMTLEEHRRVAAEIPPLRPFSVSSFTGGHHIWEVPPPEKAIPTDESKSYPRGGGRCIFVKAF